MGERGRRNTFAGHSSGEQILQRRRHVPLEPFPTLGTPGPGRCTTLTLRTYARLHDDEARSTVARARINARLVFASLASNRSLLATIEFSAFAKPVRDLDREFQYIPLIGRSCLSLPTFTASLLRKKKKKCSM